MRLNPLYEQIVALQTGQAIIFAPSGFGVKSITSSMTAWNSGNRSQHTTRSDVLTPFGQGYLLVRSRQRITLDGGRSLLAVPKFGDNARDSLSMIVSIQGGVGGDPEKTLDFFRAVRKCIDMEDDVRIGTQVALSSASRSDVNSHAANIQIMDETRAQMDPRFSISEKQC